MNGQVLHVVYEFADTIDSVWTCRDAGEARVRELNNKSGGDYAFMTSYRANTPDGLVLLERG